MKGHIGGTCTSGPSGMTKDTVHARRTGTLQGHAALVIDDSKPIWEVGFTSTLFPDMDFNFHWDSVAKKIMAPIDTSMTSGVYHIIPGKMNFDGESQLRLRYYPETNTFSLTDKLCIATNVTLSLTDLA